MLSPAQGKEVAWEKGEGGWGQGLLRLAAPKAGAFKQGKGARHTVSSPKSNMGWRHQLHAGTMLLHALSRFWKNKTQTWPQGDALLACIPTTCISTGRDSREMETDTEIRQHNVGLHADSRFGFPQPCFLTENGKKANIPLQGCGSCR